MGRSVKRYQNAAQILPKSLLLEVQRLAAGKVLYVPYPVTRRDFNRLKVLDLRTQGYSLNQIAFRTGLTRQGVCKILQRDRQRALTVVNMIYRDEAVTAGDDSCHRESGETPPSRRTASLQSEERL